MGGLAFDNGNRASGHNTLHNDHAASLKTPESAIISPFLCFPDTDNSKLLPDLPASPSLPRSKKRRSRRFSIASDSKAFYTTISVTEMQPDGLPEIGSSPVSEKPRETPSTPVREVCERDLVRTPPSLAGYDTPSPGTAEKGKTRESHGRTPPGSGRRRCSGSRTTSRSSSAARRRSRAGTHGQLQTQGKKPARDLRALHDDSCRIIKSFDSDDQPKPKPKPKPRPTHSTLVVDTCIPGELHRRACTEPVDNETFSNEPLQMPSNSVRRSALLPMPTPPLPRTRHNSWNPTTPSDDGSPDEQTRPQKTVKSTVTNWMSNDTRKREYEKIDRSTRGIRGMWRKIAPGFLQSDQRTPFYEEGKEHEGSVRRFRMDLPDDDDGDTKEASSWIKKMTSAHSQSKTKSRKSWGIRRRQTET